MRVICWIVAAGVFASLIAEARGDDVISLVGTKTYVIAPKDAAATCSVPFRYRTPLGEKDRPAFSVVSMARDGRIEPSAPEVSVVVSTTPGVLEFHFVADGRLRAGSYTVTIEATRGSDRQTLDLPFIRPAATLRVPTTLRFEEVRNLPWSAAGVMTPGGIALPSVSLQDLSGPFQTTALGDFLGPGDRPATAAVKFDGQKITATNALELRLAIDGALALGKTHGSVQVDSPDLATSLTIPVDIVVRSNKLWLAVALLAGIVLGIFLRTYLAQRERMDRALLEAHKQLDAIHNAATRTIDEPLRRSLDDFSARLEAAVNGAASPEDISRDTTAVATDFAGRLKTADDDRAELGRRARELKTRIGRPESYEETVAAWVSELRDRVEKEELSLVAGAITTVGHALDEVSDRYVDETPRIVKTWKLDAGAALRSVPPWGVKAFDTARTTVLGKLDAMGTRDADTSLKEARELTDTIRTDLDAGARALVRFARLATSELERRSSPDAVRALRSAEDELADRLSSGRGFSITSVAPSITAMRARLGEEIQQTDSTKRKEVEALLAQDKLPDALACVGIALPTDDTRASVARMGDHGDTTTEPTAASAPPEKSVPVGKLSGALRSPRTISGLLADLSAIAWLRLAIEALVLLGGGMVMLHDTFVGTPEDLYKAVLWGFTLDVSTARILDLAGPLQALRVKIS